MRLVIFNGIFAFFMTQVNLAAAQNQPPPSEPQLNKAVASAINSMQSKLNTFVVLPEMVMFSDHGENVFGVISDVSNDLSDRSKITSDEFNSVRDSLSQYITLKVQSKGDLKPVVNRKDIYRARWIFKNEAKTYTVNEDYVYSKSGETLVIFLVSPLEQEQKALDIRDQINGLIDQGSGKESKSAWLEYIFGKHAYAQARSEVQTRRDKKVAKGAALGRAYRGRIEGKSSQPDRACLSVGIRDSRDIRRSLEQPLSYDFDNGTLPRSCLRGLGDAALSVLEAILPAPTMSPTLARLGIGYQAQLRMQTGSLVASSIVRSVEATAAMINWVGDNRSRVFSQIVEAARSGIRQFNCMSNSAQTRIVCNIVASLAPIGGGSGTAAGVSRRAASLARAVELEAARVAAREAREQAANASAAEVAAAARSIEARERRDRAASRSRARATRENEIRAEVRTAALAEARLEAEAATIRRAIEGTEILFYPERGVTRTGRIVRVFRNESGARQVTIRYYDGDGTLKTIDWDPGSIHPLEYGPHVVDGRRQRDENFLTIQRAINSNGFVWPPPEP